MASKGSAESSLLKQILATVQSMEQGYNDLASAVKRLQGQVTILSETKEAQHPPAEFIPVSHDATSPRALDPLGNHIDNISTTLAAKSAPYEESKAAPPLDDAVAGELPASRSRPRPSSTSRIILTTYPNQSGIEPLKMIWGHKDPQQRGPVVVSRNQSTIRRRNGM